MSVEQEPLKCPRCDSLDTKFCYFNNYSTAQPRHFCKNCKRYWTAGGSLRNVPVGGGLRKNKKSKQAQAKQAGAISPSSNSTADEQQQQQQPFHGERGSRPLTRSASISHALAHHSSDASFPYDTTPPHPALPPVTSLPLTSPSSSAEEETLAKSRSDSVFAYADLNYLEPPSDAYYGNNYSLHLPLRNHVNPLYTYNNYVHPLDASPSLQQEQQQQQQQEQIYGSFKRQRGMGDTSSSLQAQAGEIAGASQEAGKGRIYGYGYAGVDGRHHHHHHHHQNHQHHQEQWYQGLGGPPPTQTTTGHDGDLLQASANGEHPLLGGGDEKRRPEEEEDDGLDNVVNVRYPYDWEQVSEVLFGGTPDFFQMPGF